MVFLIIVRGILILFLYFSRLISNEQSKITLYPILTLRLIITLITIYKYNSLFQPLHYSYDNISQINLKKFILQELFKLYDYPYNYITIICILFLLISLFLIIKIRSVKSSSLRKIN